MRKGNVQRAVLADFAGTLFLPLAGRQWARAASGAAGVDLTAHDGTELAALLDSRFHHVRDPGRDLSPTAHRQSMLPALELRIPIESDHLFRSNPIADSGVSDHLAGVGVS